MKNMLIRAALKKANMKQWELADILNVSEFTLSRKLRKELPEDDQQRIVSVIRNHTKGDF